MFLLICIKHTLKKENNVFITGIYLRCNVDNRQKYVWHKRYHSLQSTYLAYVDSYFIITWRFNTSPIIVTKATKAF